MQQLPTNLATVIIVVVLLGTMVTTKTQNKSAAMLGSSIPIALTVFGLSALRFTGGESGSNRLLPDHYWDTAGAGTLGYVALMVCFLGLFSAGLYVVQTARPPLGRDDFGAMAILAGTMAILVLFHRAGNQDAVVVASLFAGIAGAAWLSQIVRPLLADFAFVAKQSR